MSCVEGDFNIRVLASFLGQDFDSKVVIFVGGSTAVVAVNFTEQDDGRRPRRRGFARHLQFLRIDGTKCCGRTDRACRLRAANAHAKRLMTKREKEIRSNDEWT